MRKRRTLMTLAILSLVVSVTQLMAVSAANTATASLDPTSSCSQGRLQITVNLDVSRTREFGVATTKAGAVLAHFEHTSGPGKTYSGSYNFGSWSAQPAGTLIGLYGYMGQTPPSPDNTAEFFVAYNCTTLAVVQSCAGAFGSCPRNWPGMPAAGSAGVFQGAPIPTGFVLRMIICNTPVYDTAGGSPLLTGEAVTAGQTWYVNPTPVVGASGQLWTEIFVAGFSNPWIPTACVQGIAPLPGGGVAGGATSGGQTGVVSPAFVAAGNYPVNSAPVNASTYTVQAGDNLFRIARHFGVNLSTLASVNGISDPSRIYVGQVLNIAAAR
jgi:hypothetical protein